MGRGNPTNSGFISLMTPQGLLILGCSFFALVTIIMLGGTLCKMADRKGREERARLKALLAADAPAEL